MRFPSAPLLAVALIGVGFAVSVARAEEAKIDPSAQVDKLSPQNPDTTKTVEKIDQKRADHVQDSRAALKGLIDEPTAALADDRAPINVTETREKNFIDRKDAPQSGKTFETKDSALNGQTARDQFQTNNNPFTTTGNRVEKFQDGLRDAGANRFQSQRSELGRQTSFDQLNRFVYQRNGPGSEDGAPLVTAAGGGPASTPATTPADAPIAKPAGSNGSGGLDVLGVFGPPQKK